MNGNKMAKIKRGKSAKFTLGSKEEIEIKNYERIRDREESDEKFWQKINDNSSNESENEDRDQFLLGNDSETEQIIHEIMDDFPLQCKGRRTLVRTISAIIR